MTKFLTTLGFALSFAVVALPASAQDSAQTLSLELNSVQSLDAGCRLTFVIENNMGADLETAVFETVLFTRAGQVDRLTLFDMQTLPEGRPRVRQFDVGNLSCETLGRVLVNGVQSCSGGDVTPASCQDGMRPTSRVDGIEMLG